MSSRTRYVVAYDIRDPKRLRRVHEVATNYGDPMQYSVFVCDLNAVELVALRRELMREMHLDIDSVSIMDLGPAGGRGDECVEFIGQRPSLPDGGPAIW